MTADLFTQHRGLLTGVAYRILGSVADAEDVVQETWLRWSEVDHAKVTEPKAYLIRVTTNLAIDRLRRVRARREAYVGPWLPEPIITTADAAERAELADSVELALLVVLETLSPLERAVFVLREAFGLPHAEIAEVVGRGEPAVRQLARRAREHVRERRPRFDVDRGERRRMTERFLAACVEGDLEGLTSLLARDVTLVGDGGGKAKAPLRVLYGADHVARFMASLAGERSLRRLRRAFAALPSGGLAAEIGPAGFGVEITDVNGGPAVLVTVGEVVITMLSLVVEDGLITTVYLVANPEKLSRLRSMSHPREPGASGRA